MELVSERCIVSLFDRVVEVKPKYTLLFSEMQFHTYKSYITFVIHPPLMKAQSRTESTWEINNHGRYINQFPPNIIKSIRQYERINKKYVHKKCLLCSTKFVLMKKCFQYIYIYRGEKVGKTNALKLIYVTLMTLIYSPFAQQWVKKCHYSSIFV